MYIHDITVVYILHNRAKNKTNKFNYSPPRLKVLSEENY